LTRTARRALCAALGLAALAWPATAAAGQSVVKVSIQSPAAGATLYGTATVSGSATSKFPITSVAVAVDAGAYQPANTSAGTCCWTYSLNTNALSNGSHTLRAKATDSHGNVGQTSIAVTVNNAPPTVTIGSPAAGASVAGVVTVSGTAASQIGVTSVVVRLDNGSPGTTAAGTTNWSASLDTTQFGDGSHTIAATATDVAGHSTTASVSVTFANPLIKTYQSPWWVTPNPGWVSTVNETMMWDGDQNQSSRLPTGTINFSVNDTTAPVDTNPNDACSQSASSGYWSCSHAIATTDLQWAPNAGGWSVHYAFNFQSPYPATDTFTISYSGDGFFAASSAAAQNT
jgi:Big-like domain-containing protein